MGAGLWRKEYHEKAEGLVLTNGDIRILKRYLTGFKPGDVVELDVVKKVEADAPAEAHQCDGYAGDPGASAPRCESYRGHPGGHFIEPITKGG